MTPSEIKAIFELMRAYKVTHLKRGDLDVVMEQSAEPAVDSADLYSQVDAKYWSASESNSTTTSEEDIAPTTT